MKRKLLKIDTTPFHIHYIYLTLYLFGSPSDRENNCIYECEAFLRNFNWFSLLCSLVTFF